MLVYHDNYRKKNEENQMELNQDDDEQQIEEKNHQCNSKAELEEQ